MVLDRPSARLGFTALCVAVVVTTAACDDAVKPAGAERAPPPAKVVTYVVTADALEAERRYQGEIRAIANASLTVGEAGRVLKLEVAEGDRVQPGQRLLTLDDRLARAELGEASATRKSIQVLQKYAERRSTRFRRLTKDDVVSPGELEREEVEADRLKAQSRAARASIAALSERIQRHRIDAPFEGVVSQIYVDPGDWLTPGEAAIELVTSDRVEVHVRVPPALLEALDDLRGVTLVHGAPPHEKRVEAHVEGVVDALDPRTRTALLRLEPETVPSWIHPGGTTLVAFRLSRRGGVVVPRDALVRGIANTRVVKVVDGKATPVAVEVLARDGEMAMVRATEGELAAKDVVVVRGNERLEPGQAVTSDGAITNPAASATASGSGSR